MAPNLGHIQNLLSPSMWGPGLKSLQIQELCSLYHDGFHNQCLPLVLFQTAICIFNSLSYHLEISSKFKALNCGFSLFKGCLYKWKLCRLLSPWDAWCSHIQLSASQSEMSDCGQNWPAHEARPYHSLYCYSDQSAKCCCRALSCCLSSMPDAHQLLTSGVRVQNGFKLPVLGQLLCSHTITPSAVLHDGKHTLQFAIWTARSFEQEIWTGIVTELRKALAYETDRAERR